MNKPQPLHLIHQQQNTPPPPLRPPKFPSNSKEPNTIFASIASRDAKIKSRLASCSSNSINSWASLSSKRELPNDDISGSSSTIGISKRKKEILEKQEVIHEIKILNIKYEQWRFVNARAKKAVIASNIFSKMMLFNAWVRLNKIRKVVIDKRRLMQTFTSKLKLHNILGPEIKLLVRLEGFCNRSLIAMSHIVSSLQPALSCLPLTNGAQANVENLQDAMFVGAANVMVELEEDMLASFHSEVDQIVPLLDELVRTKELEMEKMEELTKLVKIVATLEIQEVSLRASLMQGNLYHYTK